MGEVIILEKSKADNLLSLGFKYKQKEIDGKEVFVFIQTKELMEELGKHFEPSSFLLNKTVNF